MQPKVTIYITNYNYAEYIEKAILSCINQTFENIEILIIDDGSTDNSKKVIHEFASKNKNITPIFKKNQGLVSACNTALANARGDFIIRLDADDWLDKNAIKLMAFELSKNNFLDIVFPDYYEIDDKGNILNSVRRHNFDDVKLLDQPAHGACTMFRTKTLIDNGGYDEFFDCQDGVDMWLRLNQKSDNKHIRNLNVPLFYYRRHAASLTKNFKKILENRHKILNKNSKKSSDLKTIGIIPIRGPKYDKFSQIFRKIGDKNLIDWTIDNIFMSKMISDIIISSPDEQVLKYIKNKNDRRLIPIYRSSLLATPNTLLNNSIKEAIEDYRKIKSIDPDLIVISKLNCPFRSYKHLDNAINTFKIFDLDAVLGVSSDERMYFNHNGKTLKPLRTYDSNILKNSNGNIINIKVESEEIFYESGNFIVYNNKTVKNFDDINEFRIGHEKLDSLSSFELKSEFEYILAEQIYNNLDKLSSVI